MLQRTHTLRNGLVIFTALSLYFLLLDTLGWADNIFLRLGNFVFIIAILNNSMQHSVKNGENYLNKLVIGVVTVFIGVTLSIVGLFIYLQVFEYPLSRYDISLIPASTYAGFCFALFVESLVSAIILVFILSQFYKNSKLSRVEA